MNTILKLSVYRSALEKYRNKKRKYDLLVAEGKLDKKPLESEPLPATFEIGKSELEWAEKIRREVLKPIIKEPTLDEQLINKTKIPIRKIS